MESVQVGLGWEHRWGYQVVGEMLRMSRQQQCCITHAPAQSGREQKNMIKEESYRDMEQKGVAFGGEVKVRARIMD